jgi:hypothetical protein
MGADGENRIRVAGLLIALPDRSNTRTKVRQRKWSETHETGVALGYESIDHEVVDLGGRGFVKLTVGPGQTEVQVK